MADLDRMQEMLEELLRLARAPLQTYPSLAQYADYPDGPRTTLHKGYQFNLLAPVSPYWDPPSIAYTFARPPSVGSDPSNAPDGYPRRSAKGFPLFYPLANGTAIGPGRVLQGDQSYENDDHLPA